MSAAQARLRTCPGRISWVRPANIHLTLKFLGEVAKEGLPSIIDALDEVSEVVVPFDLCSNKIGGFPSMSRPRAMYVAVDESPQLTELKENIENALNERGFEKDTKKFRPHLTLCRIRSKEASRAMGKIMSRTEPEKKVAFVVNHFVLYKSTLGPSGPRYDIIKKFPFRGQKGLRY